MILIILFAAFLIYRFYSYFWRSNYVETINKFDGPPTLFIFGNALSFCTSAHGRFKLIISYLLKYKNCFRIWIFGKPIAFITTRKDFEILAKSHYRSHKRQILKQWGGIGIFQSEGAVWKQRRQLISPSANVNILASFFMDIFNQKNEELIEKLRQHCNTGEHYDIWEDLFHYGLQMFTETILAIPPSDYMPYLPSIKEYIVKNTEVETNFTGIHWLQNPIIFRIYCYVMGLRPITKEMFKFADNVIKNAKDRRRRMLENGNFDSANVLPTLINNMLANEDRTGFTEQEIKEEIVSLFATGHGIPIQIGFVILMLAIHQEAQDKVYKEIQEVLGEDERLPRAEDMHKLNYLEQCMRETIRIYPLTPVLQRTATQNITLSNGLLIPSGTTMFFPYMSTYLDENIYPNAFQWNPDRFWPEALQNMPEYSFLSYGVGVRKCPGEKYVYLNQKATISTLIRNFKFSTNVKKEDIRLGLRLFLTSVDGYPVKIESRN